MINKIKSYFFGVCCALFCAASALPALAQESTPALTVPSLVPTEGLQTTLTNNLQTWVLIGLGLGIAVVVVLLGWRWLKRFMRG